LAVKTTSFGDDCLLGSECNQFLKTTFFIGIFYLIKRTFRAAKWIAIIQVTCSFNAGITLISGHKFFAVTRATVQVTDLVQATG